LKQQYPPETKFVFFGFSWGGYIAASIASYLATALSPVDHVLLVCPFSHYADIGVIGRFLTKRTTSLLDGLKIPKHDKLHQWHVILVQSDATVNQNSKVKWQDTIDSITLVEDKPQYDKSTHNGILWTQAYKDWVLKCLSADKK
jgi:alpha/beta superfamily hydrolase